MLSSTSFERYVATAARYGFRINKNAPWTLVANLGSPIMKEYMRPYGLEDSKNYFSEYCYLPHRSDIDKLRELMYDCYYEYFTSNPTVQQTSICKDDSIRKRTLSRKILTINDVDATIPLS